MKETLEHDPGIDAIVRGLVTTRTAKEDNIIVSDIRGKCTVSSFNILVYLLHSFSVGDILFNFILFMLCHFK